MFMILNALKAGTSVRRVEKTFSLKTQASRGIFARFQHLKWSTNAASYMLDKVKVSSEQKSLECTSND